MKNNQQITIFLFTLSFFRVSAFFLKLETSPTRKLNLNFIIFKSKFDIQFLSSSANKTICFSEVIDKSAEPTAPRPQPYFKCANDATISVIKCSTGLSTKDSCPLQYSDKKYLKNTCKAPAKLVNFDCKASLKAL